MTWTELVQAVTNLTKVGLPASSETIDVIETALKITWSEFIQTRPAPEYFKNRVQPALTTAVAQLGKVTVTTLNKILQIQEVRYSNLTTEWTLMEESQRIRPAGVEGKPRAYRMVGYDSVTPALGDRIYIEPYGTISVADDKLSVSYWERPPLLASAASGTAPAQEYVATTYPLTRWDTELIDRATIYTFLYYKKVDQAALILAKYKNPPPPQS